MFIIEATLKIIALGPYGYFSDGWNRFDFTIISMIPIELALEGVSGLSVLRSLRLVKKRDNKMHFHFQAIFTIFLPKSFSTASAIAIGPSGARVRASIITSEQFLPETPHPNHTVGDDYLHIYGIRMPRIRCELQRYV